MNINRNYLILSAAAVTFSLFIFSGVLLAAADVKGKDYEETAHTVLDSDEIITGIMDNFSKRAINVDGRRYSFCKDIMVYNTSGKLIPFDVRDLEATLEVKLFSDKTCIRKIVILRYAE